ncbi:MAG TPA: hypothetical protein EYP10_12335, partial [Armatimonadetes bacterium]|nr:hypothetical protein [Armatimonadota bacterium]
MSFWLPFSFALFFCVWCIATLVRRQWMEREQFTFPLVQLPYELTREPSLGRVFPPLFYNFPLWIGVGISALIHTLCGLQVYYPSVPAFRRSRILGEYLRGFPWDAIRWTGFYIYPAAIGLTYLLTSEVAFSLWFFYLLERAQQILFAYRGWTGRGFSASEFVQYQQVGAVIGLLAIITYAARTHWREIWLKAIGKMPELDDSDEPLPYPIAFWGLAFISLLLWLLLICLGVHPLLAANFLLMSYGFYLAVSWIATNGGMVMVQMRILPMDTIIAVLGSKRFSARSIIISCLLQEAHAYDLRETLMPSLLNAMKMADLTQVRKRPLLQIGMIGVIIAAFVSLYAWLNLCYTKGAVTLTKTATFNWHANYPWRLAGQYIDPGEQPNTFHITGMVVGLGIFVWLYIMRLQFIW